MVKKFIDNGIILWTLETEQKLVQVCTSHFHSVKHWSTCLFLMGRSSTEPAQRRWSTSSPSHSEEWQSLPPQHTVKHWTMPACHLHTNRITLFSLMPQLGGNTTFTLKCVQWGTRPTSLQFSTVPELLCKNFIFKILFDCLTDAMKAITWHCTERTSKNREGKTARLQNPGNSKQGTDSPKG